MTNDWTASVGALKQLGDLLGHFSRNESWPGFACGIAESEYEEFDLFIGQVRVFNQWFTEDNVRQSLGALSEMLDLNKLTTWREKYPNIEEGKSRLVAVVMAGNIPLVGFHDLLCVLMSGHKALIKMSSSDEHLLPRVCDFLFQFAPELKERIEFVEGKLSGFDAVIATGSNNTARYFQHYFGAYPNIIRKNRNSLAILDGEESAETLKKLGHDIFDYFGLGCRNVSKLYIPEGYRLDTFFEGIFDFGEIVNHNKYANNYDYNKAIWLLNDDKILDNGFLLLKESEDLSAPTGSLYYEYYSDLNQLKEQLEKRNEEIQCIVSKNDIPFGDAQCPLLGDYADHVDTMAFLVGLQ